MIAALLADFWPYVVAVGVALIGSLGLYIKGRRDAKTKIDLRDALSRAERLTRDNETKARMAHAEVYDDTSDDARKRMRNRDPSSP